MTLRQAMNLMGLKPFINLLKRLAYFLKTHFVPGLHRKLYILAA
jgi:hypothetical protein